MQSSCADRFFPTASLQEASYYLESNTCQMSQIMVLPA